MNLELSSVPGIVVGRIPIPERDVFVGGMGYDFSEADVSNRQC